MSAQADRVASASVARSCTCASRRQAQLERNVESTQRQYALVERAVELGFAREQVVVIDEDLGVTGSGLSDRSGFARLTAEVALGHAGLVLGLEVSRLAATTLTGTGCWICAA